MALFETARTIKNDPAYANLAETTRLALAKFVALLEEAEQADKAFDHGTAAGVESGQAAAA